MSQYFHLHLKKTEKHKFFIKKKQKILIKNEKGYWFTIDFSQNKYKEAETIHEKDALIDGTGYQKLMNSHERTRFRVTPDFILERMGVKKSLLQPLIKSVEKTAIISLNGPRRGTINKTWRIISGASRK